MDMKYVESSAVSDGRGTLSMKFWVEFMEGANFGGDERVRTTLSTGGHSLETRIVSG